MRIGLNRNLVNLDVAASHFIDPKKAAFEAYVKLKAEAYKVRERSGI